MALKEDIAPLQSIKRLVDRTLELVLKGAELETLIAERGAELAGLEEKVQAAKVQLKGVNEYVEKAEAARVEFEELSAQIDAIQARFKK